MMKFKILKIILILLQPTLLVNYLLLKRMSKTLISREKIYLKMIFKQMSLSIQALMLNNSKKINFRKNSNLRRQVKRYKRLKK